MTRAAVMFENRLPFPSAGLFQACYVTADIDAAMGQFARAHGLERFRVKRDVPSLPGMPAMRLHQAHVYVGGLQIELIQPVGGNDAIYRDRCTGDAILRFHHFGSWVDDADEFRALPRRCRELGVPIAMEISVPGVGGAIYADHRHTLGHYLEYVHLVPGVKAGYYADVPRY